MAPFVSKFQHPFPGAERDVYKISLLPLQQMRRLFVRQAWCYYTHHFLCVARSILHHHELLYY